MKVKEGFFEGILTYTHGEGSMNTVHVSQFSLESPDDVTAHTRGVARRRTHSLTVTLLAYSCLSMNPLNRAGDNGERAPDATFDV